MVRETFNEQVWRWLNCEDVSSFDKLRQQYDKLYNDNNVRLLVASDGLKELLSEVDEMFYSMKYDDFNEMDELYRRFLFFATGIISKSVQFTTFNNGLDFVGCLTKDCELVRVL